MKAKIRELLRIGRCGPISRALSYLAARVPLRDRARKFTALAILGKPRGKAVEIEVTREGLRYSLDMRDNLQRIIYLDLFERAFRQRVLSLVPKGGRIVDVGANIGIWAIPAAHQVGPAGEVTAFEPNPHVLQRFKHNIALNQTRVPLANIKILTSALSSAPGEAELVAEDLEVYSGLASFHAHEPREKAGVEEFQRIKVPLTTLDQEVKGPIDLIKIDVEGHEMSVLDGGGRFFREAPPRYVVIEIEGINLTRAGHSAEALASRMEKLGYVPIDSDKGFHSRPAPRPLASTFFDTIAWEHKKR